MLFFFFLFRHQNIEAFLPSMNKNAAADAFRVSQILGGHVKQFRWMAVLLAVLSLSTMPAFAVAPHAYFSYTQTGFVTYSFNAVASYDQEGPIVSYTWDFGDGESAVTTTPSVTHAFAGDTYVVTLTVKDNTNETNSYSRIIQTCGGYNKPQCMQ